MATASTSSIVSTVADRTSPPNIASSPKISPGPTLVSVIARPSECSRMMRARPERIT
jgi:hypothetical protein